MQSRLGVSSRCVVTRDDMLKTFESANDRFLRGASPFIGNFIWGLRVLDRLLKVLVPRKLKAKMNA